MIHGFHVRLLRASRTPAFARPPSPSSSTSASRLFMTQTSSSTLPEVPKNAHRIVLMRHGESEFNTANIFTGWCDVALTPRGIVEATEAGEVFRSHHLNFRKCYVSLLTRSIVTAHRSLEAAGISYTPIEYDWRLNERHYGALQGLSKERTAVRLGREKVMDWRRSYYARPPLMTEDHPHYDTINSDFRYRHVNNNGHGEKLQLPLGESLADCQARVIDAWENRICKDLLESANVDNAHLESNYTLVVAHANTLRALVMHLDNISVDEIEGLNIPTAIPFYYDICTATGQVLMDSVNAKDDTTANESKQTFRGNYISDDRKKYSFFERRRAADDPWAWALHDDQVDEKLLEGDDGIDEEARYNTELFAPTVNERGGA